MDWDQFISTFYMAIDSLKAGDIDEMEIMRQWYDDDDEETQVFQLVLRRDVVGRHESEKLDDTLEKLREGSGS